MPVRGAVCRCVVLSERRGGVTLGGVHMGGSPGPSVRTRAVPRARHRERMRGRWEWGGRGSATRSRGEEAEASRGRAAGRDGRSVIALASVSSRASPLGLLLRMCAH